MISALQTLKDNGLTHVQVESILDDLVNEDGFGGDDDRRCCVALLHYYEEVGECDPDDCEVSYGETIKVAGNEYRVLTDDEADTALDEYLEQILDDGSVEGAGSNYFDREAWKKDAGMDGRGLFLSSYDGEEYECGDYLVYQVS